MPLGFRCSEGSPVVLFQTGPSRHTTRGPILVSWPTITAVEPLELVVDVFATRRLVRLVVEDDITWGLRFKAAGVHERLGYLVTCPACTSVWAAMLVKTLPRWVRYGLAVSEGSIIMGVLLNEIGRA